MREDHVRLASDPGYRSAHPGYFPAVIPREGGESSMLRPLGSNCRRWNTGSSGQAGRRRGRL